LEIYVTDGGYELWARFEETGNRVVMAKAMSKLVYVDAGRLSLSQRERIRELQAECFSRVSRKEIAECFIAKEFGWVFASQGALIVGLIALFSRRVEFGGRRILLGGLGGTCVTVSARHRGLGSRLVRKGIVMLRQKKCDIACLNANIKDYPAGGLYGKLGFRLMKRPISFTDVHGKTRYDTGEMFVPICSGEIYELVMNSHSTFHIGRGYW
jgi:predicted N-acetyltransferase YhbS